MPLHAVGGGALDAAGCALGEARRSKKKGTACSKEYLRCQSLSFVSCNLVLCFKSLDPIVRREEKPITL